MVYIICFTAGAGCMYAYEHGGAEWAKNQAKKVWDKFKEWKNK